MNYPQLNDLQTKYGSQGFDVLGFPCNDFGLQEPGSDPEIWNCIKYVRPGGEYEPNFPLSTKIDVNGENADPMFKYLLSHCKTPQGNFLPKESLFYTGLNNNDIRWNFEKIPSRMLIQCLNISLVTAKLHRETFSQKNLYF